MQPSALDFLRLVLPNEGLKCVAVFEGKRVTHRFFTSFEAMANEISTQDALGKTVYHACASYQTSDSRKANNVLACKAFWLDVDAGEGKPYADAQEAAEAVLLFCRTIKCRPPLFVGSGRGIHPYWPLAQILDPETWTGLAHNFKRLCDYHHLHADAVRTADSSSILRTPGTHNRKGDNETIVRWGGPVGPYRLEELGALNVSGSLPDLRSARRNSALAGMRDVGLRPRRPSLIADALSFYGDTPTFAEPIAEGCAQVREVRDRLGRVAEPHWYAALGVLAHCADGESFAHHWSSGYAGYTHQETQSRLERARGFGPTTCEKFQGVNGKGCDVCPFKEKITSPIQLGRHIVERVAQTSVESNSEIRSSPAIQEGQTQSSEDASSTITLPSLPEGFEWHEGALTFGKESNGGEDLYDVISTYPLYLKGVQTGEINSESFALRFGLHLPNEPVKELVIPSKILFSSSGMSEIAGKGAIIHDVDLFKQYVREAVDMWNAEHRLDVQFEQYGWKDDGSFLAGPYLYVRGEPQPMAGAGEVKIRNQWLGPCKGGELGKWSGAANALFTKGCESQSFALLGSFAAPLMRFHTSGEGGSIISLVNDKSGSGKTTALEAVESVWGRKEALRLTDDDTRVSKSLILGVLANLPVTWDELYNRDPEVIRQFVLMFTNGRDKMRGTQDGGLRHNKATWQTILTLASNNSIVELLSTGDNSDAPAFRVMEFQTAIPDGVATKGDDLKRALRDNSGTAGDAYMRLLSQPPVIEYIRQALPKLTDQVWQKTKLNNEHRFWVRTIAAVAAAGIVVNKLGFLEFSTNRITDWAMEQTGAWASPEKITRRSPVSALSEFLAQHVMDTLVVPGPWKPKTWVRPLVEPRRAMQIRYERDGERLYINRSFLHKWLAEHNFSIREFDDTLLGKQVVLQINKSVTLGAGTDHASGQMLCYEIDGGHPLITGGMRAVDDIIPIPTATERITTYQAKMNEAERKRRAERQAKQAFNSTPASE